MSQIVALLTGRAGSKSVPGKNIYSLLGRPLAFYPMAAVSKAVLVDEVYVSTDCPVIAGLARGFDYSVIERPPELAGDDAELGDAIVHALESMPGAPRLLVTMHCNCAVHAPGMVDMCIRELDAHPDADSCVTGRIDNSVHPYRTKRITDGGLLEPWMEMPASTPTNRQALETCFVLDGAVRVMRVARCFPPAGQPPFTYLGHRILHVPHLSVGDVHNLADIRATELALRELGWEPAD